MERLHRPERFDSDPSSSAAPQEWRHWFMTFENFLGALPQENQNKLSQDFQRLHDSVTLKYGGDLPPLVICGLSELRVDPPELFANLSADCHPVAAKSRRY
ncbi:hypothetical protein Pcinc_028827 [Petrolisthes cinctipes]|uniref:Uncharacterized protein n=1 Tax=Petrolisthes cinctipes TaxID=88211 RepID=A0AAE1F195_PETCI|nr:hypothetical protein Pcinc_028827 [Petrolisthes cinctipes]